MCSLFSVDCYGSANATAILVGRMVGEGIAPEIRPCVHSLQAMFCVIGVSLGALLFFGKDLVLAFYTSLTSETYAPSEAFLVILAIPWWVPPIRWPAPRALSAGEETPSLC